MSVRLRLGLGLVGLVLAFGTVVHAQTGVSDGQFVRGSDGTVYLIQDGMKYPLVLTELSDAELDRLPTGPPVGGGELLPGPMQVPPTPTVAALMPGVLEDPHTLVLQAADLGPQFVLDERQSSFLVNESSASYRASFARSDTILPLDPVPVGVLSFAVAYSGQVDPDLFKRFTRLFVGDDPRWKPVEARRVGDESQAYVTVEGDPTVASCALLFRVGSNLGGVTIVGSPKGATLAEVERLALLQASRYPVPRGVLAGPP